MRSLDKFEGCLLGGAAGDALGYAVEFMQDTDIFRRYGAHGITEYAMTDGIARISDDTQMTLFTANGLLLGTTREMTRGIRGSYPGYIALCYKDWLRTQEEAFPLPEGTYYSWLVNKKELFYRRSPGATCLAAVRQGAEGTIENPVNHSKGCGGIMRVAPIGLYFHDKQIEQEKIDMIAAEAAAITHGHELGYIPAAALVHIISLVSGNDSLPIPEAVRDAMETVRAMFPNAKHMSELQGLIAKATELAASDMDDLQAIRQLGEGWVAEETLAIAVYCSLKYSDDFDKALIASVNHSGDSDSTGAVTGNIMGACLGMQRIPSKYRENLELEPLILEIAKDLWHDCRISEYSSERDEVWEQKYIYMNYGNSVEGLHYRLH